MRKIKSIQIKAAFLMVAFSLNTIIGFACAVGMDMNFNLPQHEEIPGSKIQHHQSVVNHCHDISVKDHRQSNEPGKCCDATKIAQGDKTVPEAFSAFANFLSLSFFVSPFYYTNSFSALRTTYVRYFVQSHHPPIPDIRIAIRSFQI